MREGGAIVGVALLLTFALGVVAPAGAAQPPRPDRVEIVSEGNRLEIVPEARVPFHTLVGFSEILARPLTRPAYAMRLVRVFPPEAQEFILCITSDGTLVLGVQVFLRQGPGAEYVFFRGAIERGYSPLQQTGAWTWLVPLSVGREMDVTLEIRALSDGWPVPYVMISAGRRP